jgi:hypothetical protein
MNQLDIEDLSIVLAVRNHNPNLLTLEFLQGSGVIPTDWQLARPPVLSTQGSQVLFQNGIKLEAQPGTVSFSEAMGGKTADAMEIPAIARRYAAVLPNLDYRGVGINPRKFVAFEDRSEAAHQYMTQTILSPGSWQNFGTAPIQAGINLVYTLERCQFRLGINEARLNLPDREIPAIVFIGNFNYGIGSESVEKRLQNLTRIIEHWQDDWATYEELIENQFLAGVERDAIG